MPVQIKLGDIGFNVPEATQPDRGEDLDNRIRAAMHEATAEGVRPSQRADGDDGRDLSPFVMRMMISHHQLECDEWQKQLSDRDREIAELKKELEFAKHNRQCHKCHPAPALGCTEMTVARFHNDDLKAENAALREKLAEAREVIRPFKEANEEIVTFVDSNVTVRYAVQSSVHPEIMHRLLVRDFRRAAAFLAGGEVSNA